MFRETVKLRMFALLKIPVLFFVSPSVTELTDEGCTIRIPLGWRTRNHLRSMYFASLCAGADAAGGLMAMRRIELSGRKVSLIFADFHATFLKRAEGDVYFTCRDGAAIRDLVNRTIESGERQEITVHVVATVPSKTPDPVAEFALTLSLKRRD